MGKGSGFGKVILFNEHFVVHGIPAIASAIDKKTTATVRRLPKKGIILHDERDATFGYKKEKKEHQKASLNFILKTMEITDGLEITLDGNLRAASGVGASAASCAAIARAIADEFQLKLTDERINQIAYEGEKGYHGTPSGIDNAVATFGGLVWFEKGKEIKRLKIEHPIEIVMGDTGIVANTKKAVEEVRKRKEKYSRRYKRIFGDANALIYRAQDAILTSNWRTLGELMNKNHELLNKIEVSSKELDLLVSIARENGAYGAKMTGGGLGGYMVALTPGKKLQERVLKAIKREGFYALDTKIGI